MLTILKMIRLKNSTTWTFVIPWSPAGLSFPPRRTNSYGVLKYICEQQEASMSVTEKSLKLLKSLPRVTCSNVRPSPARHPKVSGKTVTKTITGQPQRNVRTAFVAAFALHTTCLCPWNRVINSVVGSDYNTPFSTLQRPSPRGPHHGHQTRFGKSGQASRGTLPPLGYEGGQVPFHVRIPTEPYYKGFQWVQENALCCLVNNACKWQQSWVAL